MDTMAARSHAPPPAPAPVINRDMSREGRSPAQVAAAKSTRVVRASLAVGEDEDEAEADCEAPPCAAPAARRVTTGRGIGSIRYVGVGNASEEAPKASPAPLEWHKELLPAGFWFHANALVNTTNREKFFPKVDGKLVLDHFSASLAHQRLHWQPGGAQV